jgi:predicted nucleic acid-binding protein
MILYLGTSSLIKLYVEDADSKTVRQWVSEAEIVATCRLAYTEAISALDMRFKKGDLSSKDYNRIFEAFTRDWKNLAVLDFDDLDAGRLLKKYGLSRMDAVHLSAARKVHAAADGIHMAFSSVSERLGKAAAAEGLRVLPLG